MHASGKWLYTSNRTENSLGSFSLDASGRPHAQACCVVQTRMLSRGLVAALPPRLRSIF